MIAWKLAISPATAISASTFAAARPENRAEAVEDRFAGRAEGERAVAVVVAPAASVTSRVNRDRRVDEENEEAKRDQREHAEHDALRHVALGIGRLFRRERHLFDGKDTATPQRAARRGCHDCRKAGTDRCLSGNSTAAPVAGSAPIFIAYLPKSKNGIALTKKMSRIAIASRVTMTVTVNDSSTPRALRPTNMM